VFKNIYQASSRKKDVIYSTRIFLMAKREKNYLKQMGIVFSFTTFCIMNVPTIYYYYFSYLFILMGKQTTT